MPAMDDPTNFHKIGRLWRHGLAGSSCQDTGVGVCPGNSPGAGYFNKIRRWRSSTAAAGALLAVAFAAARTGLGKRRAGLPRQVGVLLPLPCKLGLERVQRARHGLLEVRAARVLRVQVDHLDHAGRGRGGGARSGASGEGELAVVSTEPAATPAAYASPSGSESSEYAMVLLTSSGSLSGAR